MITRQYIRDTRMATTFDFRRTLHPFPKGLPTSALHALLRGSTITQRHHIHNTRRARGHPYHKHGGIVLSRRKDCEATGAFCPYGIVYVLDCDAAFQALLAHATDRCPRMPRRPNIASWTQNRTCAIQKNVRMARRVRKLTSINTRPYLYSRLSPSDYPTPPGPTRDCSKSRLAPYVNQHSLLTT